jgi:hydroxyethylthiazole kinase-like uncharacterized protein yjeF
MGITEESWLDRKPHLAALEAQDVSRLLPKRMDHSNKGSYGKLLVIAGSVNMAGAAIMCARAAYRSGCGLVKILTAEENRVIIQSAVPEAILSTYGTKLDEMQVVEELKWADAVVLGPGIGTERNAQKLVSLVLKNCAVPLLLDADALNVIAKETELLLRPHTEMVVTPHLGEMARLTGDTVSLIQTRLVEYICTDLQCGMCAQGFSYSDGNPVCTWISESKRQSWYGDWWKRRCVIRCNRSFSCTGADRGCCSTSWGICPWSCRG